MGDPMLACEGIHKRFFGVPVLRNVGFQLGAGEVLGLIGQNGAGKSTLMNIIGGVLQPDAGAITVGGSAYAPLSPREAGRHGVAFIHQELNLFTNLSIAENIFIDGFPRLRGLPLIDRRAVRSRTRELLAAVDLDVAPEMPVERLAPGERQLVEIAKALSTDARIMIFDEPTTSLTARETERLFALIERLRARGTAIVYISHILGDVRRLCDTLVVLRDGEVVGAGAASAFSTSRMIALMVGRTIEQLYPPRTTTPTTEAALEVCALSQRGVVHDINLTLHKGEVLGLFGLMGAGRSELARILFGLDPFEQGTILVDGLAHERHAPRDRIAAGLAFVTENRRDEGLLMDVPIADNLSLAALPAFARAPVRLVDQPRLDEATERVSRSLSIKSAAIKRQPVKSLSGGNQQKVVIGKWLLAQPSVFILDEPTRGVDVGAKHDMYRIINDLAEQGAGVLLISSELEELIGTCDRILVLSNGEIQRSFERSAFDPEQILRAAFREHTEHVQ